MTGLRGVDLCGVVYAVCVGELLLQDKELEELEELELEELELGELEDE